MNFNVNISFSASSNIVSSAVSSVADIVIPSSPAHPSSPLPTLWLKGSRNYQDTTRLIAATANGDPIGSRTDSGSTGPYHPSQSTSNLRPTLLLGSTFKGHPAIRYTSTQNLTHTSAPLTNSRTRCTVMAVYRTFGDPTVGGAVFDTTFGQMGILAGGIVTLSFSANEYGSLAIGAKEAQESNIGAQLSTLIYDGTLTAPNRLKYFRNLVQESLTFTGTIPATTYTGGQGLFLGRQAAGAGWPHDEAELLVWENIALTDTQRQEWESYASEKLLTKTTKAFVVNGDSNAAGTDATQTWVYRALNTLGWSEVANASSAGLKIANSLGGHADKRDDWHVIQPLVIELGTNDIIMDSVSLDTLQGYFTTYISKMVSARYPIFVCTIPGSTSITGANETTRTGFNSWLLAGVPNVVGVIDFATTIGTPADGLHFNDAEKTIAANTAVAAFQAAGYV